MTADRRDQRRLRVAFFGMGDEFMLIPLRRVAMAHDVVAAVAPHRPEGRVAKTLGPLASPLRAVRSGLYGRDDLRVIARRSKIPLFSVRKQDIGRLESRLADAGPDVCCIAGFPWILPPSLLGVPQYGFLNVHPSILPAYRGPSPLFWMFRNNDPTGGITIHRLDAGEDTGPIARTESIDVPQAVSGVTWLRTCSDVGARLLLETLDALAVGRLEYRENPETSPTARASRPDPDVDYVDWDRWGHQRIFHFLRGVMPHWYTPPLLRTVDRSQLVPRESHEATDEVPVRTLEYRRGGARVRCLDGWIEFASRSRRFPH